MPRSDAKIFYAAFAKNAYKNDTNELNGYFIDSDLSDNESQVWLGKNGEEITDIIHAIRGTSDLSKDILTDIFLVLDNLRQTKRYKSEKSKLYTIIKRYPNTKIVLTGHSLGGALAIKLGEEYVSDIAEVHAYNPGVSLVNIPEKMLETVVCKIIRISDRCKLRNKLFVYHSLGDVISALGVLESDNTTITNPTSSNPHTINNFMSGGLIPEDLHDTLLIHSLNKDTIYRRAKELKIKGINSRQSKREMIDLILDT